MSQVHSQRPVNLGNSSVLSTGPQTIRRSQGVQHSVCHDPSHQQSLRRSHATPTHNMYNNGQTSNVNQNTRMVQSIHIPRNYA